MSTRWTVMDTTSPSGRTMFKCGLCGRESYAPDKTCIAGCGETARGRSREMDPGPDHEPRPSGCVCQWEIGDSPCPVHPTCENCGLINEHADDCSREGES